MLPHQMSDKVKFPRAQALPVAQAICAGLKPLIVPEHLLVCGSLRRRKAEVGDVEFVFIPRLEDRPDPFDLFGKPVPTDLVGAWLEECLKAGRLAKRPNKKGFFTWGAQNKLGLWLVAPEVTRGNPPPDVVGYATMPVDFFATTRANWWLTVVIRTGPKELNLRLIAGARKKGLELHAYGVFTEIATQQPVIPRSERHVFELCGEPYLEPWER